MHLLVILNPHGLIRRGNITGCTIPIIKVPIGGLYCSMTTVETGKALVLERKMARTATAMRTSMIILSQDEIRNDHQSHWTCELFVLQIPMISEITVQWIMDRT